MKLHKVKDFLPVVVFVLPLLAYSVPIDSSAEVNLNGSWAFRFEEGKCLEEVADGLGSRPCQMTDTIVVPGCYDMMPKWYMKRGTGLYRRTFTIGKPMKDAVLVVDGMGVRAKFSIDGKDLGVHPYPYARLEISVGQLGAGEHEIFAAIDNILEWPRVKLVRPYYDFYLYGGFYHGVKLVERAPKVFVRTLDYKTGKIEVEIENGGDSSATLSFDGGQKVNVKLSDGRATVSVPDFRLWSPESPSLHKVSIKLSTFNFQLSTRFGIRQIEAKNRKVYLNGKELFLNPALPAARVANACKMGLSWGLSLKFFMRKFWAAVFEIENSRPIFSSAASRYRADKKRHMIVVVSIGG